MYSSPLIVNHLQRISTTCRDFQQLTERRPGSYGVEQTESCSLHLTHAEPFLCILSSWRTSRRALPRKMTFGGRDPCAPEISLRGQTEVSIREGQGEIPQAPEDHKKPRRFSTAEERHQGVEGAASSAAL